MARTSHCANCLVAGSIPTLGGRVKGVIPSELTRVKLNIVPVSPTCASHALIAHVKDPVFIYRIRAGHLAGDTDTHRLNTHIKV